MIGQATTGLLLGYLVIRNLSVASKITEVSLLIVRLLLLLSFTKWNLPKVVDMWA